MPVDPLLNLVVSPGKVGNLPGMVEFVPTQDGQGKA